MKGDSVFVCACWLFESMDCGLVLLWVVSIAVRGKKGECGVNVRASESCQPIDASKNTLIDLSSMWKIRIGGFSGSNGVDGEPGTIWSHVGNLVGSVNREPMSCEFSECQLA